MLVTGEVYMLYGGGWSLLSAGTYEEEPATPVTSEPVAVAHTLSVVVACSVTTDSEVAPWLPQDSWLHTVGTDRTVVEAVPVIS